MTLEAFDYQTNKQIERVDEMITSVLNDELKSVGKMIRTILFYKH